MSRKTLLLSKAVIAAAILAAGAAPGVTWGQNRSFAAAPAPISHFTSTPFVHSFFNHSFGFFGYSSPFISVPTLPPPYPYMPKYWWTGAYGTDDPRQSGYNPSAGYRWDDVSTLLLTTYPKSARIVLDGSFIGGSDDLGPIQLPFGEHTLRVEAPGYEPSETVVRVEAPSLQQLQINLKATGSTPAPRL